MKNCPKCGTEASAPDALFCGSCGSPLDGVVQPPVMHPPNPPVYIPNNLALAIVAIIMCWPLGIAAVIYASQVDGLILSGQYDAARRNSELAKKWSIWAIGLLIGGMVLYFLFFLFMFGMMAVIPAMKH